MSSEMRYTDDDLRVIVQDWSESDPDQAVAINLARECLRHRALLARTEAGAVKCSDCDGDGETCLAGRSAHRSNWIKCAKCNGTGDAAPVADGAVPLWISCHWREDLARDSVVSVVNRQDPAHTLQVYVSTHPHDASAVTEAMVERAMNASMPGGSTAWVWLFNCEGGMRPEDKHLDWFRRVLTAALPSPPKEREE